MASSDWARRAACADVPRPVRQILTATQTPLSVAGSMVYLAAALVLVAFLGWDVARREVTRRSDAARTGGQLTEHRAVLDAHAAELAKLTARVDTQEKALLNGIQEMRALLAPVRRAVLQAVPDETRKQRKEG